ncbi:uncharacterized protein TOT_040000252 [Theileria orientalis strain Shintoku]|uniref:EF-hand domain-containing protein n=1 Tax=Theileria orientalis strain Shintoku TaxID=869250 RepID=J4CDW9_THEOR|nr:uncharacterized protein TOT_040000252 [Theileria orientalis strain Shintoku]BAM41872.1 uncharacterized protein TOT_040000252 [Theileria orientalis strain Shintoku]|eukprot:XP_009692173.1 uncharacterized protein TOT_040000252 [Theileria orientalis strain Shintoku]
MLGIVFRSIVRRSESSLSKTFESVNDCFKLLESNTSVPTKDLYDAFKYLVSDMSSRKNAVQDERFPSLLNQLDSRIGTLNSSYLGNFALRLNLLSKTGGYVSHDSNRVDVDQAKKLIEKIATTMIDKGGHIKEITQVAYAAASMGIVNHPIYEFEKQQVTLNIDLATPDSINLSIMTSFKRSSRDRVYLALLCEKLSELTDRFTAKDVVMTLGSLSKLSLMKGFLLRRLLTLMMDNLDQFTDAQLVQCANRLALLKFFTPNNFKSIFNTIKPRLQELPTHLKVELLMTSCLSNVPSDNKELIEVLENIKNDDQDMLNLTQYIYSCVYYKYYGNEFKRAFTTLMSHTPFIGRKYAVMAKEAFDTLYLESNQDLSLSDSWRESFDNIEKTEKEKSESQPIFQESKKILESSGDYKYFEKVGPYVVTFVDHERKRCIDVEYPTTMTNLALKLRNLDALGYKAGVIRYWEWRRLRTEKSELQYVFRLYDKDRTGKLSFSTLKTLLKSIGIYPTKGELEFLEYEESVRGGFTLDDLYALGDSFYTNSVIKQNVMESLRCHFNNFDVFNETELKNLLIKLGKRLRVGESEIDSFFRFYINDKPSSELTYEKFIDE